jgi:hypothetical protein
MPRHWWGGPPGPRGTPPSRCRHNGVSILQGESRPTGASAAVQGDRPTSNCPTTRVSHIYVSNLGSNAFKNLTSVSRTMAPVSSTSS